MPKKKIKKNVAPKAKNAYLIQNEDEQQILSWWDATMGSWTNDPLEATVYKTQCDADKEVTIIHDDGIEYNMMFSVPAEPILKKTKEWKENPPIKYIDKPAKSKVQLKTGTVLLDRRCVPPKPILLTYVNESQKVFSVEPGHPVWIDYHSLDALLRDVEAGFLEVLWNS